MPSPVQMSLRRACTTINTVDIVSGGLPDAPRCCHSYHDAFPEIRAPETLRHASLHGAAVRPLHAPAAVPMCRNWAVMDRTLRIRERFPWTQIAAVAPGPETELIASVTHPRTVGLRCSSVPTHGPSLLADSVAAHPHARARGRQPSRYESGSA